MAALLSVLFVLIWSTGFIVAKGALPHAAPQPFLVMRMMLTALLLAAVAWQRGDAWPRGRRLWAQLFTGALLNGVYLTFAYTAIWRGMPAGIMALLSSTQPVGIAVYAYVVHGEKHPKSSVVGLIIAVLGVICVLAPDLISGGVGHIDGWALAAAVLAVAAMAIATVFQRSHLSHDAVSVSASLQNAGGIPVALIAALILGDRMWDGSVVLWGVLAWSVVGLSAIGISLIVWLSRHHGPTQMSALLLAVPPLSALEAYALFDERLTALQAVGFVLAIAGVFLTRVPPALLMAFIHRLRRRHDQGTTAG